MGTVDDELLPPPPPKKQIEGDELPPPPPKKGGGFTPVTTFKKSAPSAPEKFQITGPARKAQAWENLGDFVPNTVLGGLQKDAGQAITFVGNMLPKGPMPLLTPEQGKSVSDFGNRLSQQGQEHIEKANEHRLPNTTGGNLATSATDLAPLIIELSLTPEAKIANAGKLGEVLAKYGGKYAPKIAEVATGKFPTLMGAKGLTSGYSEAKEQGLGDKEALAQAFKKSAQEYGKGALFEAAGAAAGKVSETGAKALEKAGLMSGNKLVAGGEKALLHSSAQAAAFSTVPFITNALEGKTTSLDELKNNAIFGGVLGLFHGGEPKNGEPTPSDGAAKETLERSPLIDLHNFVEANPETIKYANELPEKPIDLQMKSAAHAEEAFKDDNPESKQDQIIQSSINGKLASIKAVTETALKDKEGLINSVNDLNLPDEAKQQIIDKINQVHQELDPTEQFKTKLGQDIQDIDQEVQSIPEQSDNPIEQAENEVKLENLTKQKDELTNQLKQTIIKQNEKSSNEVEMGEQPNGQETGQGGNESNGSQSEIGTEENGQKEIAEAANDKKEDQLKLADNEVAVNGHTFVFHNKPNESGYYFTDVNSGKGAYGQREVEKYGKPTKKNAQQLLQNVVDDFLKTPYGKESGLFTGKVQTERTALPPQSATLPDTQEEAPTAIQPAAEAKAPEESKETTLRNADVESKRKEYGFDEPLPRKGTTNEEFNKQADDLIKDGYDAHALMDKVLDEKKPISGVESTILAKFQGSKEDELLKINDKIEKSIDKNDVSFSQLVEQRDKALDDLQRAYKASEASGTIASDALRARQLRVLQDYSLANLLVRKRIANGGERLSETQVKEVTDTYKELKERSDALEAHIEKLKGEENQLLAKKAIREAEYEARKTRRSTKKEVIDQQIDETFANLKKISREQLKRFSANPIPVEFLPEIAKLVKLYAKKGIITTQGMVDRIYNGLKDDLEGLTKDHVLEAIGLSTQKDPLKAAKTRMRTNILDLERRTREGDFSKRRSGPIKLDKEGLELRDALEKARYEYELALHRDALKNRTDAQKARDTFTEIANVPRALMASTDFSAPLRQGLVMTVSHPIKASQAFIHMFKSAASEKAFNRWFYDLKESPDYATMKESKLYIADPHKPELAAKEEQFMTNLANKIPVIGKLVEGSERAYVAYLNKLRVDLFRQSAELFEMDGKTVNNSPDLYKGLAKFINNATGRGDFKNENVAQALNTVLFSPRLIASRINLLNPLWYRKLPKEVRVQAIGDMLKFFAVGTSVLALASLNGAKVETDPRSADFGKIRVGDRRWDIWGGFAQYARLLGQVISGETKSSSTGKINKLNSKTFGSRTRLGVLASFGRSKLAPVPGFIANALDGIDAIGQDFDPYGSIPKNLIPLTLQDTYQAIQQQGIQGLFETGVPTTFGVGVQSYSDKKK